MKTIKLLFLFSFLSISFAMSGQTVFTVQGEAFTSSLNGSTATTSSGYNGTGYALMTNTASNYLEWNNVTVTSAGYYNLKFRYQNKSGATHNSTLSVNSSASLALSFLGTSVWSNSIESTIYLASGANIIRLTTITASSPLIDELTLTAMSVVPGEDFSSNLNGSVATTTTGYNGTAYAAISSGNGNYLEWNNITTTQAGYVAIQFRHQSGSSTAQNCVISLNGSAVHSNYRFEAWTSTWKDSKVITAYLPAGTHTLRITTSSTTGTILIDDVKWTQLSGPIYQAENATFANQPEASNWAGYIGSGFIKVGAANNDYLEFNNVYAPTATTATLRILYTADTDGGRPCDLYVNNTFIQSLFTVRSYWNIWKDQTTQSINLNAGMNTIKFVVNNNKTTTGSAPNIDQFELIGGDFTTAVVPTTFIQKNSVFVNNDNRIVILDNEGVDFEIFNISGQQIEQGVVQSKYHTLPLKLNAGIYIVKAANKAQRIIIQ